MAILEELKKRRLAQIALVYLGAGWLCVEIADFIVSTYSFSRKILDTVVMLAVLGFPAFLIIGWFHGERGHQRVQRSEVSLLVTLGVMAAIGTYQIATGETPEPADGGVPLIQQVEAPGLEERAGPSLAVFPFQNNISDPDLEWLGAGLADLLTTNFAQLPGLNVVARQSLYDLLTEEGRTEDETIPAQLATTLARAADAQMMLSGSVSGSADDFVLNAQITEISSGVVQASGIARGPDVFELVDELTQKLIQEMRPERRDESNIRLARVGTKDIGAFRSYQMGVRADLGGRPEEATEHFADALARDSTFMLPLAHLKGLESDMEMDDDMEGMIVVQGVDDGSIVVETELAAEAIRAAERHRTRLQELSEAAGVAFEGATSEEFFKDLESTISRAVSGFRRIDPQQIGDTVRRRPPPRSRPDRPNN